MIGSITTSRGALSMTLKMLKCATGLAGLLLCAIPIASAQSGAAKAEGERVSSVAPFKAHVPDAVLDDLRRRLLEARWPDQLPGAGWEYGADIGKVRELAEYWRTQYDFRAFEARLNRLDQFTTEIDGERIHFIHERSPRPDAIPLLLIHGWLGSVIEFMSLVEELTN